MNINAKYYIMSKTVYDEGVKVSKFKQISPNNPCTEQQNTNNYKIKVTSLLICKS